MPARRVHALLGALAVALFGLGCRDANSFATATVPAPADGTTASSNSDPQPVDWVEALGGRVFERPTEAGAYPGDRIFVADQEGTVWLLNLDGSEERVLLDLSARIEIDGSEEGLLSLALDPEFRSNGHLWAYYTLPDPKRSRIARFTVVGDAVNLESELVILEVAQPYRNHNGGALRFGPDGMIYLGLGDGGSANDPLGSGQDRSTLLGSVIRIDVRDATPDAPYVVPPDNPFVDEDGVRPEIWAYGLRNPWRMSFDSATGELWLGDVGQEQREEINIIRRGENYGWDIVEGDLCHEPREDCSADGLAFPVEVYDHSSGHCSVTGGLVYRGSQVPEIAGNYLYIDLCRGWLRALPADGSGPSAEVARGELWRSTSFAIDADGEVYLLRFNRSIVKLVSP